MDGIVTGKVEKVIGSVPTLLDVKYITISRYEVSSVDLSKVSFFFNYEYGRYWFFPQEDYFASGTSTEGVTNITDLSLQEITTFTLSMGAYEDTFTYNKYTKVLTDVSLSGSRQIKFCYW